MKIKNSLLCLLALGSLVLAGCDDKNNSSVSQTGQQESSSTEVTSQSQSTVTETSEQAQSTVTEATSQGQTSTTESSSQDQSSSSKISSQDQSTTSESSSQDQSSSSESSSQDQSTTSESSSQDQSTTSESSSQSQSSGTEGGGDTNPVAQGYSAVVGETVVSLVASEGQLPPGAVSQFEGNITAQAGQEIVIKKDSTQIYPGASGEGNNLAYDEETKKLNVVQDCVNQKLYLKVYVNEGIESYDSWLNGYVEPVIPHVLGGTLNGEAITLEACEETLPEGVKSQLKATLTNIAVDDQLAFTLNGDAITVTAGEDGNNLSSDLKVLTACASADLYLKENNDDSYSAWLTGYVEPIPPHVLGGTLNGEAITLEASEDTLPEGVKSQLKATLTNIAVDDQLAFTLNGEAITVTAGEDGNNLSSDLKVLTACASADLYLKENNDDSYSAWLTGYVEPVPVLSMKVNGVDVEIEETTVDPLDTNMIAQYKATITAKAGDVVSFAIDDESIDVVASGDNNNLSYNALTKELTVIQDVTDKDIYLKKYESSYGAWLDGFVPAPTKTYLHLKTNGETKWADREFDYDDVKYSIKNIELNAGDEFVIKYGEDNDTAVWLHYSDVDGDGKTSVSLGDDGNIVVNEYSFYDILLTVTESSKVISIVKHTITYEICIGKISDTVINANARMTIYFDYEDPFIINRLIDGNAYLEDEYTFTIGGDAADCFYPNGDNIIPGTYYFVFDLNNHKVNVYKLITVNFDDGGTSLWGLDNPKYAVYCFGNNMGSDWFGIDGDGNFSLPTCYNKFIIVRFKPDVTTFKWDEAGCQDSDKKVWNKTADLDYPGDNRYTTYYYEITGWGSGGVSTGDWVTK